MVPCCAASRGGVAWRVAARRDAIFFTRDSNIKRLSCAHVSRSSKQHKRGARARWRRASSPALRYDVTGGAGAQNNVCQARAHLLRRAGCNARRSGGVARRADIWRNNAGDVAAYCRSISDSMYHRRDVCNRIARQYRVRMPRALNLAWARAHAHFRQHIIFKLCARRRAT